jgi:hypothetical protein
MPSGTPSCINLTLFSKVQGIYNNVAEDSVLLGYNMMSMGKWIPNSEAT